MRKKNIVFAIPAVKSWSMCALSPSQEMVNQFVGDGSLVNVQQLVKKNKPYTEYFSKWRGTWIAFNTPPTQGQVNQLLEYHYILR